MNKARSDAIQLRLAEWREQGADRLAPLRFRFIEALSARAGRYDGGARRLLDERLSGLLHAYQEEIVEQAAQAQCQGKRQAAGHQADGPLAGLVAHAAHQRISKGPGGHASDDAVPGDALGLDPALIDYFRNAWARASANGLLRQSQAQVPDNAGPLNSSSLVHRALTLMREQSPGYLHHFLSYLDALSWMEQLNEEKIRSSGKSATAGKRKAARRQA